MLFRSIKFLYFYQQKDIAEQVAHVIIANENPKDWSSKIKEYIDNPIDKNKETLSKIQSIAYDHQLDNYMASILYHSQVN